ncbi:MAG TPA: nickel pincer cofactor biosynthesis protein LarC [Dissulfurispiraceae bacterium]|nr:nickel pincer cofactor biosynthesis protein LarC [Dissulfurispiraceae bacterium]
MKIAHLDAFSGLSGDMLLGVLVDAGVSLASLRRELKKIPIDGYSLSAKKVMRHGITATKVDVHLTKLAHPARTWKDICRLIKSSAVSPDLQQKGLHVFELLFQAEAKVHGMPFEHAHLHELSAVDCIVDIFGSIIGLHMLGVERLSVSPINMGSGTVKTAHGILPVPAPATAELLKGFAAYGSDVPCELTTPTGAAILNGLSAISGPMPVSIPFRTAYGAGNKDLQTQPNVLRLMLAHTHGSVLRAEEPAETMVLETNIDDMNPQIFDDVMDKLLDAGALDVWLEQVIMKKSRPAAKICILADGGMIAKLAEILFINSTTLGVRVYPVGRIVLDRTITSIRLPYGTIRAKVGRRGDAVMNTSFEYADLKVLSGKTGIPIKKITADALRAFPDSPSARKKH